MSNPLQDAAAAIVSDAAAGEAAPAYDLTEVQRAVDDESAIVSMALQYTKPWQVRRKETASPSAQIAQAAEAAAKPKQTIADWVKDLPADMREKISEAINAQEYAELAAEGDATYTAFDNDGEPVEDPAFDPWYEG